MAIKSIEEIMGAVRARVGEDTSDEALAFVEDIHDTLNSLSSAEDWKQKYEKNDAEWRAKYKERFFNPEKPAEPEPAAEQQEPAEKLTFDKLFDGGNNNG